MLGESQVSCINITNVRFCLTYVSGDQKTYLHHIWYMYIYARGQGRVSYTYKKKASVFKVKIFPFIIYIWYIRIRTRRSKAYLVYICSL